MGKQKEIVGDSGVVYQIDKEIGKGGQGRVFSILGGKYAFKLIGLKSSKKSVKLDRKITYLKTRDIGNLPISMPIEQVKGKALGYIMHMAEDMMSIQNLIKPDSENNHWWRDSGGIKKRIEILINLCEVLIKLHEKGLVYGDFSFSNIFVSDDKNFSKVFLIDCDNITGESKAGEAVYTPGYGAPEIMSGRKGYTTYSDYYSFAIIAYQLLTLNHPFVGDYVSNGEVELEEKAYLGEIPWVNHSKDFVNISSLGIPGSFTISSKMMKCFQDTFEEGVFDFPKRTSMKKWKEVLVQVKDMILLCNQDHCKNHFLYNKTLKCSSCQEKNNFVGLVTKHFIIKNYKKELKEQYNIQQDKQIIGNPFEHKTILKNQNLIITNQDFSLSTNENLFSVRFDDTSVYLKGINLNEVIVLAKGAKAKKVSITSEIKISKFPLLLMLDDLSKDQIVLKIKIQKV